MGEAESLRRRQQPPASLDGIRGLEVAEIRQANQGLLRDVANVGLTLALLLALRQWHVAPSTHLTELMLAYAAHHLLSVFFLFQRCAQPPRPPRPRRGGLRDHR